MGLQAHPHAVAQHYGHLAGGDLKGYLVVARHFSAGHFGLADLYLEIRAGRYSETADLVFTAAACHAVALRINRPAGKTCDLPAQTLFRTRFPPGPIDLIAVQ